MSLGLAGLGWVTPLGSTLDGVWDKLAGRRKRRGEVVRPDSWRKKLRGFLRPARRRSRKPPAIRGSEERARSRVSRWWRDWPLCATPRSSWMKRARPGRRWSSRFRMAESFIRSAFFTRSCSRARRRRARSCFPRRSSMRQRVISQRFSGSPARVIPWSATARSGLLALQMAEDVMMANPELDRCLVVGAEELDWLLCDAYRRWRLLRAAPPIEPFARPARGTILSEGAGAVLLTREGRS